jgi:ABC-type phosphate transport system permease subunit
MKMIYIVELLVAVPSVLYGGVMLSLPRTMKMCKLRAILTGKLLPELRDHY